MCVMNNINLDDWDNFEQQEDPFKGKSFWFVDIDKDYNYLKDINTRTLLLFHYIDSISKITGKVFFICQEYGSLGWMPLTYTDRFNGNIKNGYDYLNDNGYEFLGKLEYYIF